MRSHRRARILERATGKIVESFLIDEVSKEMLLESHNVWEPFRTKALERLRQQGKPLPENWNWDWSHKAGDLEFLAYRCMGIQYQDQMQGLIMLSTIHQSSQLPGQNGKPVIYVEYLEVAPWNLVLFTENYRFAGVGSSLLEAAVLFSDQEGCSGRLALHSLPQAEGFYRQHMTDLGAQPPPGETLIYFEMSTEQAKTFLGGRNP